MRKRISLVLCTMWLGGNLFGDLSSILAPLEMPKEGVVLAKVEVPKTRVFKAAERREKVPEVVEKKQEVVKEEKKERRMLKVSVVDVVKDVGRYLVKKYDVEGELKLTPMRNWPGVTMEGDSYEVEVLDTGGGDLRSSMNVSFRIVGEKGEVGKWVMPLRCVLYQDVYYTTQRFVKGGDLEEGSVRRKIVDVLKLQNRAVSAEVDLRMYEVVKTVGMGKPLLWKDVGLRPHVRKGKVIDLVAEEAGMRIATKGVAMESGLMNDFIKVRNIASKRDIQAKIINENTVEVYF